VVLRAATADDALAIHALISAHLAEGHLLPRSVEEIALHATRFVVATRHDTVVGCAELAPLSARVAEIRSFVVAREARAAGIGRQLVQAVLTRAEEAGVSSLCAFTHTPGYFLHLGFSIVPHTWLPEKIATDCHACERFRQCGQYAVVRSFGAPTEFITRHV
jgi:amino-acid N-acetyltransferase